MDPPEWTRGLFEDVNEIEDVQADLKSLETELQKVNLNYRVFSADVMIRGAKWSAPAL